MPDEVIKIPWDAQGTFLKRPNRFLGIVDIDGPKRFKKRKVEVHVHDPGRLKELLYPHNNVLLQRAMNSARKTKWDLIAARHEREWILVHSGYHRQIAEWVLDNPTVSPFGRLRDIKAEARFGSSRLDFLLTKTNGKKLWVEVKGCTLAENGVALFPDAPTMRGTRHINDLIKAKKRGHEAAILMLVFRPDARCFSPHEAMDFEFAGVFWEGLEEGVAVHALRFFYRDKRVYFDKTIPLCDR